MQQQQTNSSLKRKSNSNTPLSTTNKRARIPPTEEDDEPGRLNSSAQLEETISDNRIPKKFMQSTFRAEETLGADRTASRTLCRSVRAEQMPIHYSNVIHYNLFEAGDQDPLRAKLLLSSETHRVTWLYFQPGSTYSVRPYSPTMVNTLFYILLKLIRQAIIYPCTFSSL